MSLSLYLSSFSSPFFIITVVYDHTVLPNSLVQVSLYGRRLFKVKIFRLTFFFPKIATAFIHLLASGIEELSSPCLSPDWALYVGTIL